MDLRQPIFDFRRNLIVQAGAGTGKTYNLVRLYVHLLAGLTARPQGGNIPLSPENIACITFTDAAALEMKHRIRSLVVELCNQDPDEREIQDLKTTALHLGLTLPDRDHWERVRRRLPMAFVGTYHSFAQRILRENAVVAGLDPHFTLMTDTEEVEDLFEEVAREILLREAKKGGRAWDAIYRYQLTQQGDFSKGLLEHIKSLHDKMKGMGRRPETLLEEGHYSIDGVERNFRGTLNDYINSLESLASLSSGFGKKTLEKLAQLRQWMGENSAQLQGLSPSQYPQMSTLVQEPNRILNRVALKDSKVHLDVLRSSLKAMEQVSHTLAFVPIAENIQYLLTEITHAYAKRKAELGVLDFSDLLLQGRDLLRNHPQVRQHIKMQLNALLVDEFQDTNAIQRDLIYLLGEKKDHAAVIPPGDAIRGAIQLEKATLFVVGDWKQSIYGFRGADIAVFNQVRQDIKEGTFAGESEAEAITLRTNRRTIPPLIEATNRIFVEAMPGGSLFDGRFKKGEDDLKAFRDPIGTEAPLELWSFKKPETGASDRDQMVGFQAKAVARRILQMVRQGSPLIVDSESGEKRPPDFGDICILFRTFSRLQLYVKELILLQVPHLVVQGRGFYGAQEVRDLVHMLALLGDPSDEIALLGVLRSPLVGLSDQSLAALALNTSKNKGLYLPDLLRYLPGKYHNSAPLPDGVAEAEGLRLFNFLSLFNRLSRQADRLGPESLLQATLDATAFDITLAGTFQGTQAIANIEKLLAQARTFEEEGNGGLLAFVRRMLRRLEREPKEPVGHIPAEGGGACRLMTIHQSKGLEFPIVFIPEATAGLTHRNDQMLFEEKHGFAVTTPHPVPGEKSIRTGPYDAIDDEQKAKGLAESRRIFYVALTRARDHGVLFGVEPTSKKQVSDAWMGWVWQQKEALIDDGLLQHGEGVDLAQADMAPFTAEIPEEEDTHIEVAVVFKQALPPPPSQIRVRRLVAPVTQLDDFQLCPRRYHFWHELNLEEFPSMRGNRPEVEEEAQAAAGSLDPLRRGTLAHDLLERVPLHDGDTDDKKAVDAMLIDQGYDLEDKQVGEVRDDVLGLLGSDYGKMLRQCDPDSIHREWPFLLEIKTDGDLTLFLTGKMDLLIEENPGEVRVVDYKHTLRKGRTSQDYHFQLMAYALAAREHLNATSIHAEILFLRDRDHQWEEGPMALNPTDEELNAFQTQLGRSAQALVDSRLAKSFAASKASHCQDVKCGYLWRCHPELR